MRNIRINDVLKFIRDNDTGMFKGYSNNALRNHIFVCLRNKCIYVYYDNNNVQSVIEYYREVSYDKIVSRTMTLLKNKKIPKSIDIGKYIWINNIIGFSNLRCVLRTFRTFIRPFDNIYWWKLKHNKIIICRLK